MTRPTRPAALRVGGLVLGVALALALAFPSRTGLTGVLPFAQVIAFRPVLALALIAAAAGLLALGALAGRRARTGIAGILVLAAILQAGVLAGRGLAPQATRGAPSGQVVVLTANTQSSASATDLANLVRATGADVAVFPETTRRVADDVAARLAASGIPMQVLAVRRRRSNLSGTAMLVGSGLGTYRIDQVVNTVEATFTAVPVDGSGPTLVAVHTEPPARLALMRSWRADTALATATCRSHRGAIVAGDFNATLDHPAFADLAPCLDAAQAAGAAALGTWPSAAPRWLSAPIDHVLVDGRSWRVLSVAVLDAVPGADHRPVLVHLTAR